MSAPTNAVHVAIRGRTDVGLHREHNEDAYLVAALGDGATNLTEEGYDGPLPSEGLLFVVADGMGGAAAGEVASRMAVECLFDQLRDGFRAEADGASVERALESAVSEANAKIWAAANQDTKLRGMGTTVTAAVAWRDAIFVAQVGDSRGYLLRREDLVQLTKDQSLINQLIEDGTLTAEEAEKIGGKNIILQALGVDETVKADMRRLDLLDGDRIVVCSDGLTGMIDDAVLRDVLLANASDLDRSCASLIDHANEGGGRDNISVIVGRFAGGGLRPPTDGDGELVVSSSAAMPPGRKRIDPRLLGGFCAVVIAVVLFVLFTGGKTPLVVHFVDGAGAELEGVTVTLVGPDETIERTLDGTSMLELTDVAPGHWTIRASRPGYGEYDGAFEVAKGRLTEFNVPLDLTKSAVTITVPGLDDAEIELARASGEPDLVTAGTYTFYRAMGTYALVVTRRGYQPRKRSVVVGPGDEGVQVTIELEEATGTLVLLGVRPGSELTATEVDEGWVVGPTKVEAGTPIPIRVGHYDVRLEAPLYETWRGDVVIVLGKASSLDVDQAKPKGTIRVEVDRTKYPDADSVDVLDAEGERANEIFLDEDGKGFAELREGAYVVRLADGVEQKVELLAGATESVAFR